MLRNIQVAIKNCSILPTKLIKSFRMRSLSILAFAAFILLSNLQAEEAVGGSSDADNALRKLLEGNQRYVDQIPMRQRLLNTRRIETAKAQHPFAIIVSCSDSRVPPELIFDQGLGDLFVIRIAGNIVDDIGIGSIEYAAEHLGAKLIMVLGHKRCGAVTAASQPNEVPGHIKNIVDMIRPSIQNVGGSRLDRVDFCIRENAVAVGRKLRETAPILSHLAHEGKLKIVSAYYDLDSGVVSLLDDTKSYVSDAPKASGTELSHDAPVEPSPDKQKTATHQPSVSTSDHAPEKSKSHPAEEAVASKSALGAAHGEPPPAKAKPAVVVSPSGPEQAVSNPAGSSPNTKATSDEEFLKALREFGHEMPAKEAQHH